MEETLEAQLNAQVEEYEAKLKEEYEAKLKEEYEAKLKEKQEEYEAKLREKVEEYEAKLREKEEYEAKLREEYEAKLVRSNFKMKIYNKEIVNYTQLLAEIDRGNFKASSTAIKKVANTDYIIKEGSSISSKAESSIIYMTQFDRQQVDETKDRMDLVLFDLPLEKFVRDHYKDVNEFDDMFNKATADLEKVRECLLWLEQNGHSFDELFTQQIFTIYCSGLLSRVNANFEVYAINRAKLTADIRVKIDGTTFNKKLVGMSDVAIGSQNTTECFGLDELKSPTTVLVELKKSFGSLSKYKCEIGNSTNQQLAQLFALSQMREKSGVSNLIDKSILCDLFFTRIALRLVIDDKVLFAITTMYTKSSELVLCIFLVLINFTVSDVLPYIVLDSLIKNSDTEIEEDDKNVEDDHEEPRNLLLHATASKKEKDTHGKNYKSRRRPLSVIDDNILLMDDEDPLEEAKERQLQKQLYLAEWDACRLGRPYLSSANLNCKDRVI